MAAYNIVILASLTLFGLAMLVGFTLKFISKQPILGAPPIDRFFFFSGKIAMFLTWGLMIWKAVDPKFGDIKTPVALDWCAAALVSIGVVLALAAIGGLGGSIRVGLPREETRLHTGGLYRFSRNPLYAGVFLVTIASGMYFPETGNIGLALYAIGVHHAIIINEEKFLEKKFGEEYVEYKKKVMRYLGWRRG